MKYKHRLQIRASDKDLENIAFLRQHFELEDDSETVRDVLKLMVWYIKRNDPKVQDFLTTFREILK